MNKKSISLNYKIVNEPEFQNQRFGITPQIAKELATLGQQSQAQNPNPKVIPKLNLAIEKYPHVPQFKNYLSAVYNALDMYEQADMVNDIIVTEHPEYLFGKINAAHISIDNGNLKQVLKLLGEGMEIQLLYPERDTFHLAEVLGFNLVAIRYFVAIEDLELASNRFELMVEIAADHPLTAQAQSLIMPLLIKLTGLEQCEKDVDRIAPKKIKNALQSEQTNDVPKFNHPEIEALYEFGFDISPLVLKKILTLPRKSLILDLESILSDAVHRFSFFLEEEQNNPFANTEFVFHALSLLMELKASESLPKIFEFLSYDEDFLGFWLGDIITESLWNLIYKVGISNIDALKEFLLKPNIASHAKGAVATCLSQMVLHEPKMRRQVLIIFFEVFTQFEKASLEDNLIDTDFLSIAVSAASECHLDELLPVIKSLYDKDFVSLNYCGNYQETVDYMRYEEEDDTMLLYDIYSLYQHTLDIFCKDEYDDEDEFEDDRYFTESDFLNSFAKIQSPFSTPTLSPAVSKKIGRNEPCPCGSGLKYKTCCLEKMGN